MCRPHETSHFKEESKSGLFSGGGIGVPLGSQQKSTDQRSVARTAAASTVAGDVTLSAGQSYSQRGSDVLAPGGDVSIQAQRVTIEEARESNASQTEQRFKQSGITLAISGGIVDTLQSTAEGARGVIGSGSNRSRALNALIAYGKGSDLVDQGSAVMKAAQSNGLMGSDGKPGAAASSGVKISVSVGGSRSESTSTTSSDRAAASTIKAGGDVKIQADGGEVTVQGSSIRAGGNLNVTAAQAINIQASADTESSRSSNKSSSASVGVSFGVGSGSAGLSINAAASQGKGSANSDRVTHHNSRLEAEGTVRLESGGDTLIHGGTVTGRGVKAEVGGNLRIESVQDTEKSKSTQSTVGFAVSVPVVGAGGSASASMSKAQSASSYVGVVEQSGIRAGEEGFQIHVESATRLVGAAITGSAGPQKNELSTRMLTTEDLENRMSASASSSGVSLGTSMLGSNYELGKGVVGNLMNRGEAGQSDTSTTRSAIDPAQVTINGVKTDTSRAALRDSNQKVVSSQTSTAHRALQQANLDALQTEAREEQADNMLLFKAAVAISDDGLKKLSKPRLYQVFCLEEPCSNDQVVNNAKIGRISLSLLSDNPGLTSEEANLRAIAAIAGKNGDPSKADPKEAGTNPNREIVSSNRTQTVYNNIQTLPVTIEDLESLPNDEKVHSSIFTNGIFNERRRAGELTIQQVDKLNPGDPGERLQIEKTGTVLRGNTYLVHVDKSNNVLGELVVAGVDKLAEILGVPTPAAEIKAKAIKTLSTNNATGVTDNPIDSPAQSRGTMSDVNALRLLGKEGFYNPNLRVIMNNPAAKEERIREAAAQVTKPDQVEIFAPINDPVSTFIGGYGKENNLKALKELPEVIFTPNSVHSSAGSGAVGSKNSDVNKPFSYGDLDIDKLNNTRSTETRRIIEQIESSPASSTIAPSVDPTLQLRDRVQKQNDAMKR